MRVTIVGSCLKTGQHFIFVIIAIFITAYKKYLIPYQRYCLHFFIANNYDSNNENIAP